MELMIKIENKIVPILLAISESHYHNKGSEKQKIEAFINEEIAAIADENSGYYNHELNDIS